MYLTQYTDYSLRVLIFAAIHKERLINIAEIAQAYQISQSHLMKVAAALVRGGFLHSVRGKNGGLYLGAAPQDIAIGAVVRHMEPMQIVECMGPDNHCCIAPNCQLAGILTGAANAFLEHLDGYTLADLLYPETIGQLYRPPENSDKPIPIHPDPQPS